MPNQYPRSEKGMRSKEDDVTWRYEAMRGNASAHACLEENVMVRRIGHQMQKVDYLVYIREYP
jgi:hypothetical protein